jgi:hypothetical protein
MSTVTRVAISAVGKSFWGILALTLITVLGFHVGLGVAGAAFFFFLCVLIQAVRGDFWSAVIIATAATFGLAFFFTPPVFSFKIAKPVDVIALLVFVIVAFVTAHIATLSRAQGVHTMQESAAASDQGRNAAANRLVALLGRSGAALAVGAALLLVYGLAWNYSSHRYLKGFADAIIPLEGSAQEKTEALLAWFRHEPQRSDSLVEGTTNLRDPVNIVQNEHLLKVCGSASNAFMNLADAAGLRARRLLLLAPSGSAMHVVAEVRWGDRWVVVDPQQGQVFTDHVGRALTRDELHHPEVFRDAISRMPRYNPAYTFERTAHLHLQRLPWVGDLVRRTLDRLSPGWEEAIDWGYAAENPSLWPILLSLPMLFVGILGRAILNRRRSGRVIIPDNGVDERELGGAEREMDVAPFRGRP